MPPKKIVSKDGGLGKPFQKMRNASAKANNKKRNKGSEKFWQKNERTSKNFHGSCF